MFTPSSSTMTMYQVIALVLSALTLSIAVVTAVVKITRSFSAGGARVEGHIERLTDSMDRLSTSVETGFAGVHEEISILQGAHGRIKRRLIILEQHNGLDSPSE